jgi:hypothetical protein
LGELVGTAGEGLDQATQGAAIGKVLSPVADAISKRLKGTGVEAAKLHLRPTAGMKGAIGEQGLDDAAEESLKAGAIQPFSKAKTTAQNLDNLAEELGAVKGDIVNNSTAKIDPTEVAATAHNRIVKPMLSNSETEAAGEAMARRLEGFVDKYAPEGQATPGRPTTITRHSQFIPKEPVTDFSAGYGETTTIPDATGLVDAQVGEPVTHYRIPEASPPYATDPRTGLPVKQLVERRIEGNAPVAAPSMSVEQLDAVKQAAQAKNNYMATSPQAVARQQAGRDWANVVKEAVEKAEPDVIPANRALHNIYNAQDMAGRTANHANNGGGLMGHMTDVGVGMNAVHDAAQGRILGPTMAVARAISKGRVSSTLAAGAYGAGSALEQAGAKAVNPIAQAISSRLGYSSPRENQPQSTPKDPASIRQTLIDQQTSPAAQQALKDSQE